jgi:hypothetical protein
MRKMYYGLESSREVRSKTQSPLTDSVTPIAGDFDASLA